MLLTNCLEIFFKKDVPKQNGDEYEPDSLSRFQRSIQRRLKELKLYFNILKDQARSKAKTTEGA